MARSLAQLVDTTQEDLLGGIIDKLMIHDQTTAVFLANAAVTDRYQVKGNRLESDPVPVYADCSTEFANQNISAAPFTYDLETLAVQFNACLIGRDLYSSFNDVVADELNGALRGMSKKIAEDTINGTGVGEIYGVQNIGTLSLAVATPGSVDVEDLEALLDLATAKTDRGFFVGSPATVRKVNRELRSESENTVIDVFGTAFRAPSFMGYPILKNSFATDGTLTFVDPLEGYRLFLGERREQEIGGIFALQDLGPSQTKLEHLWRVYTHIAGVMINPQAVVTLTGII